MVSSPNLIYPVMLFLLLSIIMFIGYSCDHGFGKSGRNKISINLESHRNRTTNGRHANGILLWTRMQESCSPKTIVKCDFLIEQFFILSIQLFGLLQKQIGPKDRIEWQCKVVTPLLGPKQKYWIAEEVPIGWWKSRWLACRGIWEGTR